MEYTGYAPIDGCHRPYHLNTANPCRISRRHKDDGVTHYKGNYGNSLLYGMLSLAPHLNAHRPELYGIEDEAPVSTFRSSFGPLVTQ